MKALPYVILLGGCLLMGIGSLFWIGRTSATNDIFLIPEGYEGPIQVNYNIPGAPPLQKEGKYDVIPINADGTYSTSNPDMDYGVVTDKYFYVDASGRRTAIDDQCVHVMGNGSKEEGSAVERYTYLEITGTRCGEDFMLWGQ